MKGKQKKPNMEFPKMEVAVTKQKKQKGITLIALVVTIVVLLILSGVTINTIFSNDGILTMADEAKEQYEIGALKDSMSICILNWEVQKGLKDNITIDDLWINFKDANIITDPEQDISEPTKQGENDVYEVTTNEGYLVEIIVTPDGKASIGDIAKGDKLPPKIVQINTTNTTNSIHIEVLTSRLENGTLSYYYKKSEQSDYIEIKKDTQDLTADIANLEQNVLYDIKVTATNENGTVEKVVQVTTGELKAESISQKGETIWSNGVAQIELETTQEGVTIQYQIGGIEGTWLNYSGPITGLHHGDTVYAIITDGISQSKHATINVLDNLTPQIAQISIANTATAGKAINATVTHVDNESGVNITKCKWVYNTNPNPIGIEEASYTGGSFSSNGQSISVTAATAGTYYLHALTVDMAGNKIESISNAVTVEKAPVADGSFNAEKGVNTPDLQDGALTPVKWVNNTLQTTTADDPEWYSYTTTDKKWANAQTKDGSLWVWIPRYAYQISSNYHTNSISGGTINIKFMKGTTNEAADGTSTWSNSSGQGNWNIHPGFNYSSTASGLWVAKFEASQSDAGANAADYQNSTGGTSGIIKIQPGVNSWRNITIDTMYTKCLNYDTETLQNANLNSHLMKNTEWGAVAYLAQSSYGKNAEVWINPNSNFLTGQAGSGPSVGSTTSTSAYNSGNGPQASSTGTVYGVYDMSGGAYEYTAAYVNNGNSNLTSYGSSLVSGATYTKDVYTKGSADDRETNYNANSSKYGDAVYETSLSSNGTPNWNTSWYSDYSYFPCSAGPFFIRGGNYIFPSNAGLFCFNVSSGHANSNYGFRPVLVPL